MLCSKLTLNSTRVSPKNILPSEGEENLQNAMDQISLSFSHPISSAYLKIEHLRTEEEKKRSEELLNLLMEIVAERDKLVGERNYSENWHYHWINVSPLIRPL
ncbi:hypothetical protein ACTXT7_004981 [Hymenolepis weldensis]